jgi:2-C-methyl-D-erythritol 4-phosphate cytidylyltransferase
MRVCLLLPAAGSGTRFGGDKLAQDLGGRSVLLRTVELFTRRDEVASILVAAPPDDLDEFRLRYGAQLSFHGARIVPGSKRERWETVQLALAAVPDDCTHVAVHDAARPAASDEMLSRVFAAAAIHDAVIPGVAITSTLKRVSEDLVAGGEDDAVADAILGDLGKSQSSGRRVTETVPRSGLVAVQTPQVFRTELLRRAYAASGLDGVTDDAQVVERLGHPVVVVDGDSRNIKITTPDDLALVRAILGVREAEGRPVHKRF